MVASVLRSGPSRVIPRHVAVIMDGNGRWARRRALPRQAGHKAGIRPVRATVERCAELGVEYLTLFAFSSENWNRPPDEVRGLMRLFLDALEREVAELDANGVRLRFIGDIDALGTQLRAAVQAAEARTAANTGLTLSVAVAYGGRWDITQAARRLAAEVAAGRIAPDAIDETTFGAMLATRELPGVDLLIRTGGEQRISNFLLWDIAYSEVCFCEQLWPEFGVEELERAFEFYASRERRFGRTGEQAEVVSC